MSWRQTGGGGSAAVGTLAFNRRGSVREERERERKRLDEEEKEKKRRREGRKRNK